MEKIVLAKNYTPDYSKCETVTNGRENIIDCVCAYDIETTYLKEHNASIMYVWMWKNEHEDFTIVGRTWGEFHEFINRISRAVGDRKLIAYVHNLSYEFHFLWGVEPLDYKSVMCPKSRRILKCNLRDNIELRCSYMHSNMSLDQYARKMGAKHKKLSGTYDYSKIRYPWTHLSRQEWKYCIYDVLSLVESIRSEMTHDGDTLATIPLTSTGYVRRDAKMALRRHRNLINDLHPDEELYKMLNEAFRGGNTHANRFYVGKILSDVYSDDRSSSYPDVQCNCKFPVTKFKDVKDTSLSNLLRLRKRGYALLMRIVMRGNIRLIEEDYGCPYISISKCRNLRGAVKDNGRVLAADYLETTVTDIDLDIILDQYTCDNIEVIEAKCSKYGKLPSELIETIEEYYTGKTSKKNVPREEIYYEKSKNKLNSIYGMSAQNPGKVLIQVLSTHEYVPEKYESLQEVLDDFRKRLVMPYQWGVWTTAWARYYLELAIRECGDNFIYTDTDSVKHFEQIDFSDYNLAQIRSSEENGAYATDPQGVTHYMGVLESDGRYDRFLTWGSKIYAYEQRGKLSITIAGVNKQKGAEELKKHGGLEALLPGFIFHDGASIKSTYNDNMYIDTILDGHPFQITPNVALTQSTYEVSNNKLKDYKKFLTVCDEKVADRVKLLYNIL